MDVEHAFRRRVALLERLARIEATGHPYFWEAPEPRPASRHHCPGSAGLGEHGDADWKGCCPYCGYYRGRGPMPRLPRVRPDFNLDEVLSPRTLEPVDALEREEVWAGWTAA